MGGPVKARSGYTILEVLIAVIILAIILPSLTVAVIGSRKTQTTSLRFENAAAYAQRVYDSLSLLPASVFPATTAATGTTSDTLGGQTYTAQWTRTPLLNVAGAAKGGATLSVDVGWNVGGKAHRSVLTGGLE
jgi:prepilin-type N-terminal cleavage/methylation domain-containing protein